LIIEVELGAMLVALHRHVGKAGELDVPSKNNDRPLNGPAATLLPGVQTGDESLPAERCLQLHRIMVRARAMEERTIKMSKSGEGYFWIGGPGEEAFNACLGLQIKKGRGPEYDILHLHYRNEATLVAMGMPLIDGVRPMDLRGTESHCIGRTLPRRFS